MKNSKESYDEFMKCRTQWKNDIKMGFWKDFVKLALAYNKIPPKAKVGGYVAFYGPMHSSDEDDKPTGNKIPNQKWHRVHVDKHVRTPRQKSMRRE